MSTSSTNSTALITTAEFLARYDVRAVQQLLSDAGVKVDAGDVDGHVRLAAALLSATGWLEMACTTGKRYTPADLATIANAGGASASALKDLLADIVMGRLFLARPSESGEAPRAYTEALKVLDRLGKGELALGLLEVQDAGVLEVAKETTASVESRRDGVVIQADRYFGRRSNRST